MVLRRLAGTGRIAGKDRLDQRRMLLQQPVTGAGYGIDQLAMGEDTFRQQAVAGPHGMQEDDVVRRLADCVVQFQIRRHLLLETAGGVCSLHVLEDAREKVPVRLCRPGSS